MAASFIGGGNRSIRRKQPTCRKWLTNFITYCCIEYTSSWTGFELTTLVLIGTDCTGSCKSNYNTINATTPPVDFEASHRQLAIRVQSLSESKWYSNLYIYGWETFLLIYKKNVGGSEWYLNLSLFCWWFFLHHTTPYSINRRCSLSLLFYYNKLSFLSISICVSVSFPYECFTQGFNRFLIFSVYNMQENEGRSKGHLKHYTKSMYSVITM